MAANPVRAVKARTSLEEHGGQGSNDQESGGLKGRGGAAAVAVCGGARSESSFSCFACRFHSGASDDQSRGSASRSNGNTIGNALEASVDNGGEILGRAGSGGRSNVTAESICRCKQKSCEGGDLKALHFLE